MNKKNKIKAIIAIVVAMVFILSTSAVFANDKGTFGDTIVSIDPLTQTVEKEQSFTVDVYVVPDEVISGVQFDLYFDQTIVQADLVTEGDLFSGHSTWFDAGTIDNLIGKIEDVYGIITDTFTEEEDTISPVTTHRFNGTKGKNCWYISDVEVTLIATDEGSGVGSTWYSVDGGYWKLYINKPFVVSGDKKHTVEYYSFDRAGNREDTKKAEIKIDTKLPSTTHEFDGVIGKEGWFVSNVTVTLSAEDQPSGVNYSMYKLDDGTWMNYTDSFDVTEDSEYILHYYSVDIAGNREPTNEVEFKIDHDTLPPVTTHEFDGIIGDNEWYTSNVVVMLSAEDDSAGVESTYYKLDDNVEWQDYTGSFLVTEDGEHTIVYYSVDRVGNEEEPCDSVKFKIDQTAPIIDLTAENTGGNNWLLTANVADETSGIAKVEFYVDSEDVGEVTKAPYELEYTGSGSVAQAIGFDKAGNLNGSTEVESHSQSQQPIRMLFIQFLERFLERFPLLEQILLPVLSRMLNIY